MPSREEEARMPDQHTPPLPETKPSYADTRALLQALRDPREQRSRLVITSAAILVWLGIAWWLWSTCGWVCALLTLIGIVVFAGTIDALSPHMVRTQGIRVGPDQLPTLYRAVTQCAERLQLTAIPDVYVLHETVWNAMAIWLARRRVVVLYSAILDGILTTTRHTSNSPFSSVMSLVTMPRGMRTTSPNWLRTRSGGVLGFDGGIAGIAKRRATGLASIVQEAYPRACRLWQSLWSAHTLRRR